MYRTAQQKAWDNQNILDYAKEEGLEEGALAREREIALQMKQDGVNIDKIVKYTKLSERQIEEL
jgi:predicted transposase/invertase (TIGR01784 family)